jgi:hypothetical protein
MQQFTDLMAAIKILNAAKKETMEYTGGSAFNNPAWEKVQHAVNYLDSQAKELL